jgi:hypothetical protein
MVYLISEKNGCTYTLDPEDQKDLMYAPIWPETPYETSYSAYRTIRWDLIWNEDYIDEAERCHKLLLADVTI